MARNPDHLPLKYRRKALVDKKNGKDSSTVPEEQSLGKSRSMMPATWAIMAAGNATALYAPAEGG